MYVNSKNVDFCTETHPFDPEIGRLVDKRARSCFSAFKRTGCMQRDIIFLHNITFAVGCYIGNMETPGQITYVGDWNLANIGIQHAGMSSASGAHHFIWFVDVLDLYLNVFALISMPNHCIIQITNLKKNNQKRGFLPNKLTVRPKNWWATRPQVIQPFPSVWTQ